MSCAYLRRKGREAALLLAALSLVIASNASAGPLPTATFVPVVPGTPETRSTAFIAWFEDLAAKGYTDDEYLVSGGANVYQYIDNAAQRPEVSVLTPNVPYTTRMLVRRPSDPARFNGTVFVEVLNATAGWDGDPIWQATHEYLIRSGAAWVGVSTKPVTVNFLRDRWGRPPWPARNASRYASLSMPAFGQVWDIMTQVGELLKTPQAPGNPLAALDVQRLVMIGYSQSAAYQVTYANSFHGSARMPDGRPVYDGYYIATGGARAKDVTGATAATENLPAGDARNLVRADVPVIKLQTQTEVVNFPSYPTRQTEAQFPWVRTYEIAGGSHVDSYLNFYGGQALVRDLGLPPSFCPSPAVPYNPIRTGFYQAAAMQNLVSWIGLGWSPPQSRLMELATNAAGAVVLARDANGNVIGGVRPPEVEAPLGAYLESNTGPGFCGLFGGFAPFGEDKVAALYPNHGSYVAPFAQAVAADVAGRYLLPPDGAALMVGAAKSSIGKKK